MQLLRQFGIDSMTDGVFQTYYETNLLKTRSSSDISWIGSTQACLLLMIGSLTGPLFDAGYFNHLLIGGSFLVVFGTMMTSIATQYWQIFLAQAVTVGIGAGCLFTPSMAILTTYFTTKYPIAAGVSAMGSGVG